MKKQSTFLLSYFSILAVLVGLFISTSSCTKPNDLQDSNDPGKITFNIGGQDKQYTQINASTATVSGSKVYSIVATKEPTTGNYFNMAIMTDSLRPGTYTLANGMVHWLDTPTGGTSTTFTVTINSNVNGLVNGSFTGEILLYSGLFYLPVINGIIQNVQIN